MWLDYTPLHPDAAEDSKNKANCLLRTLDVASETAEIFFEVLGFQKESNGGMQAGQHTV